MSCRRGRRCPFGRVESKAAAVGSILRFCRRDMWLEDLSLAGRLVEGKRSRVAGGSGYLMLKQMYLTLMSCKNLQQNMGGEIFHKGCCEW